VLPVRGVSKHHARFRLDATGPAVQDLGSLNGVFVNGVRTAGKSLAPGDEIRLGPVALTLAEGEVTPVPAVEQPPSERPGSPDAPVLFAMLAAGALVAQQVVGKAVRDALFLSNFDVSALPPMIVLAGLVAMLAALGFSRALTTRPPAVVIPVAVAASAVFLGAEWLLCLVRPAAAAIVVYLHLATFGATLVSGFWSVVSERFDPLAARRAVGRIGLGATTGGALGGLLAWSLARVVPLATLLAATACLGVLALFALRRLGGAPQDETPRATRPDEGPARPLLGLRILGELPYLRHLALVVALAAVGESLLDYALKAEAVRAFEGASALVAFFAVFQAAVAVATLAIQATLSRASLESLGLAGSVALLPAAAFLCGLSGVLVPVLATAALARGAHAVLQGSLFRAGYELLFTALPRHRKRPTKTIVDVGFDRLGGAVGGALTLLVVWFTPAGTSSVFALSVACALAALLLARRLDAGYVAALEESLRSGALRLDPEEVVDSTTRLTLARTGLWLERGPGRSAPALVAAPDALGRAALDLASTDLARVRRVLREQDALDPRLASLALPWLGRDEVAAEAAAALREIAPRVAGLLADALLDASQPPALRRRAARLLAASGDGRAAGALLAGLADADFEVRFACGVALRRAAGRQRPAPAALFEAAAMEMERQPPQAEPERALDHVFHLLELALDKEAVLAAREALRAKSPLRGTALEYLANVLPERLRRALQPLLGEGAPPAGARPALDLERALRGGPRGEAAGEK